MRKPRALDLFCSAGGMSMGLHLAGFEVHGVDIKPQPRYPFWFRQMDALDVDLTGFDLVCASPPCQRYSRATMMAGGAAHRETHPDLIEPVRRKLAGSGALTCIENVPLAPLRRDVELTGQMFGLKVIRHRIFEVNFPVLTPDRARSGRGLAKAGLVETVAGKGSGIQVRDRWRSAMCIDWMTTRELAQAIPPAYGEFIGRWAMRCLAEHRVAA